MDTSNNTPNVFTLEVDGYLFTIDIQDQDLAQKHWRILDQSVPSVYAAWHTTRNKKKAMFYLHRLIMERILGQALKRDELVDHRDMNTLNCCRSNLRVATRAQNSQNRRKQKNGNNPYKGVYWDKTKSRYLVQIKANGKLIHIGRFADPEEARIAYQNAAIKYHGEFARYD